MIIAEAARYSSCFLQMFSTHYLNLTILPVILIMKMNYQPLVNSISGTLIWRVIVSIYILGLLDKLSICYRSKSIISCTKRYKSLNASRLNFRLAE